MQKITTCLWFDTQAEEAADHYVSIFPDSRIVERRRHGDAGPGGQGTITIVTFELAGQRFTAFDGGARFTFNQAISLSVDCRTQEEVDELWTRLGDGGAEGQCGWIQDRFGLWWQVVPRQLPELLGDPDPRRVERVTQAMLRMRKIDIQTLRDAAEQR